MSLAEAPEEGRESVKVGGCGNLSISLSLSLVPRRTYPSWTVLREYMTTRDLEKNLLWAEWGGAKDMSVRSNVGLRGPPGGNDPRRRLVLPIPEDDRFDGDVSSG